MTEKVNISAIREKLAKRVGEENVDKALSNVPIELLDAWSHLVDLTPILNETSSSYDERKVGKDALENGLVVSTCLTNDCGYETAVINGDVYPVQRYETLEEATIGHATWIEHCKTNPKQITELGWTFLVPPRIVTLKYQED